MERGKRASMREGPLAALFRKTEEEGLGDDAPEREAPEAGRGGEGRRADRAPRSEFRAPEDERPEPRAERVTDPSRLEELRPAPPSARAAAAREGLRERRAARPAEERL